ncbi:hypothetical protein GCM10010448_39190 [Streptomyces glomeratus]|uniref:Transposase n=1 Tax=Streptomyces glomeratus TaxID=284452 RepID=A0ABP6LMQ4_9ACTN
MAAVASGLQIVKRMRFGMRGTVQGSTPLKKRQADVSWDDRHRMAGIARWDDFGHDGRMAIV